MASGFGNIKTNSPESLFFLCLKYLAGNLDVLCQKTREGYALRENVAVPSVFWKLIIETCQKNGMDINDSFANIFKNDTKTKFKSLSLRNSSISINGLELFLRHNLYELTLIDCDSLSYEMFNILFDYAHNLEMLNIDAGIITTKHSENSSKRLCRIVQNINLKAPNLKHLVLRKLVISPYFSLDNTKLNHEFRVLMMKLEILDFSYSLGIDCFYYNMCNPTNLHTLILFNAQNLEKNDTILHICTLKTLVVLDISQSNYSPNRGIFKDENKTLEHIVKSLPELMSLDISGTNLAGKGIAENPVHESLNGTHGKLYDIPGLRTRANKPFEFLGLYHTMYNACRRQLIPAKTISGNANEEQLITAFNSFMHDKPELLAEVLNDITNFIEQNRFTQLEKAVHMVIDAITTNIDSDEVQKSGISALFRLMYKFELTSLDIPARRQLYHVLETGIGLNIYDDDVNYKLEEIVAALNLE
ncbi:protein zer-1 homolog isoform X2 [Adelges cooleyi]|uniref:protein zer-1 homolog isoform X2 n=1 Tax=Adelges cooleyi TaxID=133065 RepID=UPI00218022D5|nr:protein zer-1 homolog isoform X2 [Adelges cooleyi]